MSEEWLETFLNGDSQRHGHHLKQLTLIEINTNYTNEPTLKLLLIYYSLSCSHDHLIGWLIEWSSKVVGMGDMVVWGWVIWWCGDG